MIEQKQDTHRKPANQGAHDIAPEPNKIGASTPYDFEAKNLTAYGGLLPLITMLKKLGFQSLVEQTVTSKRISRARTCTVSCWASCSASISAFRYFEELGKLVMMALSFL